MFLYKCLFVFVLSLITNTSVKACVNAINPSLKPTTLETSEFKRTYYIAGCADSIPKDGLPIIFGFHGGGEKIHTNEMTGFLDFTELANLNALIIAPVGNNSFNGHSWINAFPWMEGQPKDDITLPLEILSQLKSQENLPKLNFRRIYAVGKSDGSGMAMALACSTKSGINFSGIGLISGAYFGLGNAQNFGHNPHEICIPNQPLPTLMIHGTGDQVMPYHGQNFLNPKALSHHKAYWKLIDPSVTNKTSNTYTADIPKYADALHGQFRCSGWRKTSIGNFSEMLTGQNCSQPFVFISIKGGNHVWPGHLKSGPDSGKPPNMDFDATSLIKQFFQI